MVPAGPDPPFPSVRCPMLVRQLSHIVEFGCSTTEHDTCLWHAFRVLRPYRAPALLFFFHQLVQYLASGANRTSLSAAGFPLQGLAPTSCRPFCSARALHPRFRSLRLVRPGQKTEKEKRTRLSVWLHALPSPQKKGAAGTLAANGKVGEVLYSCDQSQDGKMLRSGTSVSQNQK